MPRIPRMVIDDETTVYHVMSRTAFDGFPLGDIEKDFMIDLIKRYSSLYFVEILGVGYLNLCVKLRLALPGFTTAVITGAVISGATGSRVSSLKREKP